MALTLQQIVVLRTTPFMGFRPGSNLWAEVAYLPSRPDDMLPLFDGEEVEPLVRLGYLSAVELPEPHRVPGEHNELGVVEATHRYFRTPAGDAALASN